MASESEQTRNNEDSQAENEKLAQPVQSTDDYFESVNQRLKKKSRFGFGKPKKESKPKKKEPAKEVKVEMPKAPVVVKEPKIQDKADVITPEPEPVVTEPAEQVEVVEPKPEPEKVEVVVEPEQPTAEMPEEPQNVEVNVIEQPPAIEIAPEPEPVQPAKESISAAVPEITVKPEPVKEPKEKKGFFSFLRRKPKPKLIKTSQSGAKIESTYGDIQVKPEDAVPTIQPDVTVDQPLEAQNLAVNQAETQTVTEQVVVEEPVVENLQAETLEPEKIEPQHLKGQVPFFDGIVHIGKFTKSTSPFAQKAVLSIGEYPVHLLMKSRFASKPDDVLPLFIDKSSKDIIKDSNNQIDPDNIIGLDTELDAHFWFNILPNVSSDSPFLARFESRPIKQLHRALIVASIWDGVGSALLPTMVSQFNERNVSSAALAFFPSKVQSLESQFNAFAAVGKCALLGSAPIVLLDRESIENYLGVDRRGNMIKGTAVVNYLVDMMLARETLVDEFSELSKTFDSTIFTLMLGTGASLRVYGSIENILDTLLFKQFLSFDLSSAELLYVLTRVPYHLKEKVPRGKIEMATANWFKDKTTLKSIHVAEPVYVEDNSDRIDIALFVGGFNTAKIFGAIEKKVNTMKNKAVKNGLIQDDEWKEIVKKLTS